MLILRTKFSECLCTMSILTYRPLCVKVVVLQLGAAYRQHKPVRIERKPVSSTVGAFIYGPEPSIVTRAVDNFIKDLNVVGSSRIQLKSVDMLSMESLFDPHITFVFNNPNAADAKALTEFVNKDRTDRTLIVVADKEPKTKAATALVQALSSRGGSLINTVPGNSLGVIRSLAAHLNVSGAALSAINAHVGQDLELILPILDNLWEVYGNSEIGLDEVSPWLDQKGSLTVWTLLDAIDAGNVSLALENLNRIYGKGRTDGVTLTTIIRNHLHRIFVVKNSGLTSPKQVKELLGMKTPSLYPAQKAISLSRRYGSNIDQLLMLAVEADAACRGQKGRGVPERIVIELLVSRLCVYPRK